MDCVGVEDVAGFAAGLVGLGCKRRCGRNAEKRVERSEGLVGILVEIGEIERLMEVSGKEEVRGRAEVFMVFRMVAAFPFVLLRGKFN